MIPRFHLVPITLQRSWAKRKVGCGLPHVEGLATVAAYARDDLLEQRRPVMQA